MDSSLSRAGALPRVALAVAISVLAGVLLAGLAVPFVAGTGLAAKATADDFISLPAELVTPELSTRSTVLAADGSVLATFYRVNRVSVPMAKIPAVVRQAVIAIEDSRFYEHNGVDYKGTLRAAATNARTGSVAQGGSTITQQYVKNALIEAAGDDKVAQRAAAERSAERKLQEARYALAIERQLTKDEILHRYLEIAYFGNGVYGIGTAATYYFGKPVTKLTLPEAALLAGVVQNPTRFNVSSRDASVRRDVVDRRNTVLGRMADLGFITAKARAQAAASRVVTAAARRLGQDCGAPSVKAPFFCQYVRHELEDTDVGAALGSTREERQQRLLGGGLVVRTTLDPRIQREAQEAVDEEVPADDPSGVFAAINMVEPGTGHIRAMAVDRPYGEDEKKNQTQVNFATGGSYGFQPGSTFKAFFLASAVQQGIALGTSIYSPAIYYPTVFNYDDGYGKKLPVRNAEEDEAGSFDLVTGTHASVNTFYMQLAERVGLEKPLALADSLGLKQLRPGGADPLPRIPSAVLGSPTVSPLSMAGAYAAFAAHGKHCPVRAVLSITTASGTPVDVPPVRCGQAMDATVADTVTEVLTGVIDGDDPHRTGSGASIGRPAAGKTGTTNDSKAAWFVGYTPELATAVWVGKKNPTPLRRITIDGSYYPQVYGGTVPADIFSKAMRGALRGKPVEYFDLDSQPYVRSSPAYESASGAIPEVAGMGYDTASATLRAAGFSPTPGRRVASSQPEGIVAYTYPGSGSSASPGTTVYIYRSRGSSFSPPRTTSPPSRNGTASPSPTPRR